MTESCSNGERLHRQLALRKRPKIGSSSSRPPNLRGLQKVTAFKKVHRSILKILVFGSYCLFRMRLNLHSLIRNGVVGRVGDTGCLCTNAFPLGFLSFSFFLRNPSLQELFLHSQIMKVGCRAIFAINLSFLIKCYQ